MVISLLLLGYLKNFHYLCYTQSKTYLMRTITLNVYKLAEHPNKENVFAWIRKNWTDLVEHSVNDIVDCLNALQKKIGGKLDYSIGVYGESYVVFENYNKADFKALYKTKDNCPVTGICHDITILECLKKNDFGQLFKEINNEYEYVYSDEGLTEMFEAQEYEFYEDGSIV